MKNFQLKSLVAAFLLASSFLSVSCKNDDDKVEPKPTTTEAASITFTSPAMHSSFNGSQKVTIAGNIQAEKQIHGYKIILHKKGGTPDTLVDAHDHATSVNFSKDWTNNVSTHTDMEAEVLVTLDHDGNTLSKKVSFHCMP